MKAILNKRTVPLPLLATGLIVLFTFSCPTAIYAEEHSGFGFGVDQWYLSGGAAYYGAPGKSAAGDGLGPAISIGYGITEKWAVELLYSRYDVTNNSQVPLENNLNLLWANALYSFRESENWQPFVVFGAGVTDEIDRVTFDEFRDTQANIGVGIFRKLTERFSLRGDVRANYSFEYSEVEPFLYLGVSVKLGHSGSSRSVEKRDNDTDKDGIVNGVDQCPDTGLGSKVDATGCMLMSDDDDDGVFNSVDQCSDTPAGSTVNRLGCRMDSDNDGVLDEEDACPETRIGAKVDKRGCYVALKQDITTHLYVAFDSDSSTVNSLGETEIREIVDHMRAHPTAMAVIEGHTDNTGPESYNLKLSERRANAVKHYLVNQAGISGNRLSAEGFGEAAPVADNNTAAGRLLNRRVSVVIKAIETTN